MSLTHSSTAIPKLKVDHQDILPLLSAPSPALSLHAEHSLTTLRGPQPRVGSGFEAPAHAQYRALAYAVRWETGIDRQEFLNSTLEGERWLVRAAYSVCLFSRSGSRLWKR